MTDKPTPHGMCECPHASGLCCGGYGPAFVEVTRDGRRLKLCSRCDLLRDTDHVLLVRPTDPAFAPFDALGGMMVAFTLSSEAAWRASKYGLRYEAEWLEYWNAKSVVADA